MRYRHYLHLLLVFLLPCIPLSAEESAQVKSVLVICSNAESSLWAQGMLQPVNDFARSSSDVQISQYFLRITSIDNVSVLEKRTRDILNAQPRRPDLVTLVGGSVYQLAYLVDNHWPDVPVLLVGDIPYFCESAYTLYGKANPDALRRPVSDMLQDGLNVSLIHAPAMVERTVDLMFTLQPEMQKIIFIGGENFRCKEQQLRLERYLKEKYPSLVYKPVFSTEYSTDDLINILSNEKYPQTGVLFASWLTHHDYMETVSSRNNIIQILEAIAPVYTIFPVDMDHPHHVIGYYSYDYNQYCRFLAQRFSDVLYNDRQPRRLPMVHLEIGTPHISWHAMQIFNLDLKLIPRVAVIYDKPLTLWEAYKPAIMWAAFFVMLGLGFFIFAIMRRSMRSLKKAHAISENSNRMKTAFVNNINHEIRTPLNAIIGFSQLLCMPEGYVTNEEKSEYLHYVLNNSQLLTVIINDLLSLSDVENGEFVVNNAPCNIHEVALLAMKSVEYRLRPGVEMRHNPGIPEDVRVLTDEMRVQQVLINFLTNSCKHTEKGFIEVSTSLTENPGYVTFAVSDSGPGIPADKAEDIFERFTKLSDKQGAGLGLSICRIIAQKLNGNVWLDTTYTEGARFVFTIPYVTE